MEAQVSLTVAFRSSALLGLVSLIFLLTIPDRFSMEFRQWRSQGRRHGVLGSGQASLLANQAHQHHGH